MFDVVIIGAGPGWLFAAYELIKMGVECQNCKSCAILSGFGGAGTFSDGKLNFIPKLGKSDLFKYMSKTEAYDLIDDTEKIFNKFKIDNEEIYMIGDGAGKAGNIVASSATGLVAARDIIEKIK